MRKLSFSEPFAEEGSQYLRGSRWYNAKIPLVYALLLVLVILALAVTVICLAFRLKTAPRVVEDKVVAAGRASKSPGLC